MNENRYFADQQWQMSIRDRFDRAAYKFGNATPALDWTRTFHALPVATYAGQVAPAGGYKDLLSQDDFSERQRQYSLVGPGIVAGIILAILYSRA